MCDSQQLLERPSLCHIPRPVRCGATSTSAKICPLSTTVHDVIRVSCLSSSHCKHSYIGCSIIKQNKILLSKLHNVSS